MNTQAQLTISTMSMSTFKTIASKISFEPNECWIWKGAKMVNGYGYIHYQGKIQLIHRLLYAWLIEPIPIGYDSQHQLDHICNNRLCCNPKHLQLVSQKVNILRGISPTAINSKKTHCIRGHLLPTESNRTDGGRRCLICRREKDRLYWHKRRDHYVKHKPSNSFPEMP